MVFGGGSSNDVTIKVTVDESGAIKTFDSLGNELKDVEKASESAAGGFSKTQASLVSLQAAVSLARQGLDLLAGAAKLGIDAINRGAEVDDISASFEALAAKAGVAGDALLNNLNVAVGETIPNLDLMKQANELLIGGIAPDKITLMAEAARALGEQTRVGAAQGMDALTTSILKGNARAVESLGIIVDENKALAEFALANGIAADQVQNLSEEAKKLAVREEVFRKLSAESEKFGKVTNDAGDLVAQAGKVMTDKLDEVYRAVAGDAGVNEALNGLIVALKEVDLKPIISGLSALIEFGANAAAAIVNLGNAIASTFDTKSTGATRALEAQLDLSQKFAKTFDDITKSIASARSDEELKKLIPLFEKTREEIAKIADPKLRNNLQYTLLGFESAANAALDKLPSKLEKTKDGLLDVGKAGAESAKKALDLKKASDELAAAQNESQKAIRALLGNQGLSALEKQLADIYFQLKNGDISTRQADAAITELGKSYQGSVAKIKEFDSANKIAADSADGLVEYLADMNKQLAELAGQENPIKALFEGTEQATQGIGQFSEFLTSSVASSLADGLSQGIQLALNGGKGEDYRKAISETLFSGLGAAADEYLPGSGQFVEAFEPLFAKGLEKIFGGTNAGTAARKAADKFFADAFDANRLAVVIDGQLKVIEDLVFKGDTLFGGNSQFVDGSFDNFFQGLSGAAQAAFGGVGLGFEGLLDTAGDITGQIGAVIANNIGGNLNNLQLLVQASGVSFEQLRGNVVKAFEDGKVSALEAQTALNGLAQVAQEGIPDGIGYTVQAFENLVAAGTKGGRASTDALRDIGAEAKELYIKDFPSLIQNLVSSGKLSASAVEQLFAALQAAGIDSIDELSSATTQELLPVLSQLQAQDFPFAEAASDAADLFTTIEGLPDSKTFTLRVNTEFDAGAEKLVNSPALQELRPVQTSSVKSAGASRGIA